MQNYTKVKFESEDETLEYSADRGRTWKAVTTAEFKKPAELWVRKEAVGTLGKDDYVAPSDYVIVEVTDSNVGTSSSANSTVGVTKIEGDIPVTEAVSGEIKTLTADSFTSFTLYGKENGTNAFSITDWGESLGSWSSLSQMRSSSISVSKKPWASISETGLNGNGIANISVKYPASANTFIL